MKKVIIIAEAGVNHNGDLKLAERLIEEASKAGADYVKFQTFKALNLVTSKAQKANYQKADKASKPGESQLDMLQKLELDRDAHLHLIRHCKLHNIRFLSTGFDLESLNMLSDFGLELFKVPSGEITNLPLLMKIAGFGKPVLLSTGMANLKEIGEALDVITSNGILLTDVTVLHCTTEYPAPMDEVNLKAMFTIRDSFGVQIGYSDHTQGIEIPIAAVALGARVIEKHFTLDRSLPGPDHKASIEPDELAEMVKSIRNVELALGNGIKEPAKSELKNRIAARKSIHLASDLMAGHTITLDDLAMKRPGDGISPMQLGQIVGKTLKQDLPENTQLTLDHLL
ncbi:MAG: N-acetylneuraminate synthase [Lentimicrobium sp.]|jgi:N-acetylneuraminate synthase|nr:N-acetylneuraminate synthase [Lentimicrobium sp.]